MLRDCKYRLPCAWCDKYDRECYAVLYEIELNKGKQKQPNPKECEHEWQLKGFMPTGNTDEIGRMYYDKKYICLKCGKEEHSISTELKT